jgi:hypothetical protein
MGCAANQRTDLPQSCVQPSANARMRLSLRLNWHRYATATVS